VTYEFEVIVEVGPNPGVDMTIIDLSVARRRKYELKCRMKKIDSVFTRKLYAVGRLCYGPRAKPCLPFRGVVAGYSSARSNW
jgi:hypothetical protein